MNRREFITLLGGAALTTLSRKVARSADPIIFESFQRNQISMNKPDDPL